MVERIQGQRGPGIEDWADLMERFYESPIVDV